MLDVGGGPFDESVLLTGEGHPQPLGDGLGDSILGVEDVLQLAVEPFRPQLKAILHIAQLYGDAHAICRRTLPSSTVVTESFSPIVRRSSPLPLNENADVRAATLRPLSGVRAFRISSAIPSQNQSWSFAALMSVKGITAIDATRFAGRRGMTGKRPGPGSDSALQILQLVSQVFRSLIPALGVFGERPPDDLAPARGAACP